jgi:23S rRNA pseudouridine1911/1915/1917 synthase
MIRVIAEGAAWIALDKPAGMIAHRDGRNTEPSVSEWLHDEYTECRGVGGAWVSPQGEAIALNGLVHRLDKDTSGVLIAAKTQEMFDYLRGEFKARRVLKRYRAFIYGHPQAESGEIVAEIIRTNERPRRWAARPCSRDDARAAISEWAAIVRMYDPVMHDPATYLALSPKTGRTHQLRVHLASIGHPVVGDRLYAPEHAGIFGFQRLALHASELTLSIDGAERTFVAPLPRDFIAAGAYL